MDDNRGHLTQDELDDIDSPSLRMQVLTLYQKRDISERLNHLEEIDHESGKSLFREYREMFACQDPDDPDYADDDSHEAYWVSSEWLNDLYTFKQTENKWS